MMMPRKENYRHLIFFFFFFWVFAMVNSKEISLSKAKLMCSSPNISGGVSGG